MKYFLAIIACTMITASWAQLIDDFSDGDFTTNPTWSGSTAEFIVNPSFEVQLNNSGVSATSYLSTPHGMAFLDNQEWRIWTKQSFSPSGNNYGRIYLTANNADLTTDPDGFYLLLGEALSNDAVRLFKVSGGVHTELMNGTLGQISSSFAISIKVVRDNVGAWELFIDPNGGEDYILEASTTDATNLLGTHFGMMATYTTTNSTKFYYDNIYVGDEILDLTPPVLLSATAVNANLIDVTFDEAVDVATAESIGNYDIQPFLSASSATVDGVNPAIVHLVPVSPLQNGGSYTLFTDLIEDLDGNVSGSQSTTFNYLIAESPEAGDVLINEFMCDPTPQVGLKEVEFVEVYNASAKIFNLSGWKLGDASGDGTVQTGWLQPGEYMILSSTSHVDSFAVTATGVTSFPSLNNGGDDIVLKDDAGNIIDMISYTDDWYQDANKSSGGYSIERINPNDPCSDESNWAASNDNLGGTPGSQNSIYDITPDTEAPTLDQLIVLPPNFLEIYFTEGMDSTSLVNATITISPSLTIQNRYVLSANPTKMILQFNENIVASQNYSIEIQAVSDCWINTTTVSGVFALAGTPVLGDIVINEILFDPLSGGGDWLELYNNSDKLLDLFNWEIANLDDDTISNHKQVTEHFLLYPGEYVVLAEDVNHIIQNYPAYVPNRFIEMDLPSYSNDEGTFYVIVQNDVLDEVAYLDDWHFRLLDSKDGKSLERIDPNGPSNDQNNWHTAAEAIGFATPGGENSQLSPATMNGEFNFSSETISPDNDGFEDILQVNYEMNEPGLLGNFTIYDDRGRKIAEVLKSELLASRGTFVWDGVRSDNTKASIGTYVAVFEAFSIDGEVKFAKRKAFVVAGKL